MDPLPKPKGIAIKTNQAKDDVIVKPKRPVTVKIKLSKISLPVPKRLDKRLVNSPATIVLAERTMEIIPALPKATLNSG